MTSSACAGPTWPGCWPRTGSPAWWQCRWWPAIGPSPKTAVISCMGALSAALFLLTALAFGSPGTVTAVIGTAAIALWGAAANAVSPMMQAAAMRAGADDPDGASGLYMAAFQIGITAGSLAGGLLYERSVPVMLAASAVLMGAALSGMAASRQLFAVPALAEQP
ncbi:putative membrane protein [Mycobacterium xenopi 4042]|uniref:Putative membrane protein n=1 Tax=Mycobacterium xenopi 4042 TaxID=1299334 RepID=X8BIK2_MYCXE|nr:putative membrane protein [Mycobacterium xenopi 4042]